MLQVILPIILGLLILGWLPLTFEILYRRDKENDLLICNLCIFSNKALYSLKLPAVHAELNILGNNLLTLSTEVLNEWGATEEQGITIKKPLKMFGQVYPKLKELYNKFQRVFSEVKGINNTFFKQISCRELKWFTEFGLSDAALTAVTTGLIWNLKNMVYNNLHHNVRVEFSSPFFAVKPRFGAKHLSLYFKCIFAVRLGHIMVTAIKFFWVFLWSMVRKGGG